MVGITFTSSVEAAGATNVLVGLTGRWFGCGWGQRQLITVALQNGFDIAHPIQAMVQGQGAGAVEALVRVLPAQGQQAQAGAIGLFGVILAGQFDLDPAPDIGPQLLPPLLQPGRRPLLVLLVRLSVPLVLQYLLRRVSLLRARRFGFLPWLLLLWWWVGATF